MNRDDIARQIKKLLAMHRNASVGHIGGNLSSITAISLIIERLREQDRFVLSKGHSAGALYISMMNAGKISEAELSTFHKDGTRLPGHPPVNIFKEIPFATGSLGHGLSLAAGFALSRQFKNDDAKIYCLTSDGEWQEGSTWEALIFSTHHKLKNLTILIDHNELQGFGTTKDVASMNPLWEKIAPFDVEIVKVDGHDLTAIEAELNRPQERLRAIFLKTTKGKGIASMENCLHSHYLPLTDNDMKDLKDPR